MAAKGIAAVLVRHGLGDMVAPTSVRRGRS